MPQCQEKSRLPGCLASPNSLCHQPVFTALGVSPQATSLGSSINIDGCCFCSGALTSLFPNPVVAYLAETKGVSRRTAQRTVQQAYALIREDIDKANVQRSDLVAQAIHLLMESARLGLAQNNPGAVVGAVAQLDKLCGLSLACR